MNASPGRNVSCGSGTVSCFSLYNESTPSLGEYIKRIVHAIFRHIPQGIINFNIFYSRVHEEFIHPFVCFFKSYRIREQFKAIVLSPSFSSAKRLRSPRSQPGDAGCLQKARVLPLLRRSPVRAEGQRTRVNRPSSVRLSRRQLQRGRADRQSTNFLHWAIDGFNGCLRCAFDHGGRRCVSSETLHQLLVMYTPHDLLSS